MTLFDGFVLLVVLAFLIRGVWLGFVRQVAFLAALMLGFIAAGRLYGHFGQIILPLVKDPQLGFFLAYILLFLLAYLLIILLGKGLKKVMSITLLGGFDRVLGGIFGLLKAAFAVSLVFMVVAGHLSGVNSMLRNSLSYPLLLKSSKLILCLVKDRDLRDRFLPHEPAIDSLLSGAVIKAKAMGAVPPP